MRWLVLLLFTLVAVHAEPKVTPAPSIPVAVPANVRMERGASIDIPLKAIGRTSVTMRYKLRSQPEHGTLSEIRINPETAAASITYTHDGTSDSDRFLYAAQSLAGVSPAVEVNINIVEPPPRMSAPETLDFGTVLVGEKAVKTLTLKNIGSGNLEGRLIVESPWQLDGNPNYTLAKGTSRDFTVSFTPGQEKTYTGQIGYSSYPGVNTQITADARNPFSLSSQSLAIPIDPAGRTGTIQLTNQTAADLSLNLEHSENIDAPATLTIPANETVDLNITPLSPAAIDETVRISWNNFSLPVRVSAAALPLSLDVNPSTVSFGKVVFNKTFSTTLEITNTGTHPLSFNLPEPASPFKTNLPGAITLAPGEKHTAKITFHSDIPGVFRTTLADTDGKFNIPLYAEAIVPTVKRTMLTAAVEDTSNPNVTEEPDPLVSDLPPVLDVKITKANSKQCTLEWTHATGEPVQYHLEFRQLSLDKKGNLKIDWIPYKEAQIAPGKTRAVINDLQPGMLYTVRVRFTDARQRLSSPSLPVQFRTAAGEKWNVSWRWIILPALLVILGYLLYEKRKG